MKTILLFDKDKKISADLKNVKLKNYRIVFINNVKFLKHYVEEFLPSFIIIPEELKNSDDFLRFILNFSDIKLIFTSKNKILTSGSHSRFFSNSGCKNLFLENIESIRDYIRILSIIDNNEKVVMSKTGLNTSISTANEGKGFKFINQQVISVFSLQGGVGKTTLAFNLAFYLQNIANVRILIIDLNFSDGRSDMSFAVGLPESPNLGCYIEGIADDYESFLNSILSLKNLNIDFIQPPVSIFQSDKFSIDMLDNLIYHARNGYNFIIADIPYRYDNICLEMLNLSTLIFFLIFPSPGAIARVKNMQELLQGNQKKGIIINNVFNIDDFYLKYAIEDLKIPVLNHIPFLSDDNKKFLKIGKFKTGILDMQKEMAELIKKFL